MGSHMSPHSQAQLEPAGPEGGILEEDIDSSLGDDATTSTASISSSILEYRNYQGRTFHSDKYNTDPLTPNDEQQRISIDITHHYLTLLLDGKLTLAPIKEDMEKVLDVGTGTGIWAIDFADEHPNTEVIGTDLSPIQPSWVPPNVKFEIEDATNTWSWSDNTFDLVHMRYLIGSITDWGALFKEAFRCCKPGGFVESVEVNPIFLSDDNTIASDSPIKTWNQVCEEGGKAFGRSLCEVSDDVQLLHAAGFVDIQVTDFKVPVGGWAKDTKLRRVGQFLRATIENDLEEEPNPQNLISLSYRSNMVTGPGRPGKACSICKKQKIRCSGERPSCRRCVRLKNACYYDNNVVHVRARKDKSRATSRIDRSVVPHSQSLASAPSLDVTNNFYQGVPPSLVPILIDLYFENVYQSDLFLHKPSFLQTLANQTVRPHIFLSICAWGANFYRDDAGKATLKEAGLMTEWAKKAGTLVFQEAEELHEDNIQVYARCLHDTHKRDPPIISNEPRYTDGSVFSTFNVDLLAAKSSILEFTGILRSGDNGYVKSGEESLDLSSIQPDSTTLCQSPNPVVDTKLETHTMENRPLERTPHTPHTNMEQQQAVGQLDSGGNEWPTLDIFGSLLDADITSFLSMGENVDFSFLNTDMTSWGFGDEIQKG
ncbi:Ff.00g062240.m01.CDS01 [Fusarium sp. VM40]|nr:Ff.00g062240.m01.CDS01 [Fusarium sp. VM40]